MTIPDAGREALPYKSRKETMEKQQRVKKTVKRDRAKQQVEVLSSPWSQVILLQVCQQRPSQPVKCTNHLGIVLLCRLRETGVGRTAQSRRKGQPQVVQLG